MKNLPLIFLGSILGSMLMMSVGSLLYVNAATPVPTLRPIPPTATLNSLYAGPSPTPFAVIPETVDLDFTQFNAKPAADTAINIYRFLNRDHLLDLVMGGAVAVFAVALMVTYINRKTNNDQ